MAEHIEPQIINLGELLRVGALRAELADLKAELEQQRTRAEGAEQEKHDAMDDAAELTQACKELQAKLARAEQELRQERMRADDLVLVVKHCHASSTHAATMRGLNPAVGAMLAESGKLAAARAHLAGLDLKDCEMTLKKGAGCWPDVGAVFKLIAAAREVLS